MKNVGKRIEDDIITHVREILSLGELPDLPKDLVQTDNLGQIIDKMVIIHIRNWMLEDIIGKTEDDLEYAKIKRKADIINKQKRPIFIAAINKLVDNAIIEGKSLAEDSIKFYSGEEN